MRKLELFVSYLCCDVKPVISFNNESYPYLGVFFFFLSAVDLIESAWHGIRFIDLWSNEELDDSSGNLYKTYFKTYS